MAGGKKHDRINLPNVLTAARIICAAVLFCVPVGGIGFWTAYTLGGVTDMLDGPIARRTGMVSAFGAKLDSAADAVFLIAAALRLLPLLRQTMSAAVWYMAAAIALVRLAAFIIGRVRRCGAEMPHLWLNKLAGFLLFLLPYLLGWHGVRWYAVPVCLVCGVSAAAELWLCCRSRKNPS